MHDHLLSDLIAQRKAGVDIEFGVNTRIEGRQAGIRGHRGEALSVGGKQIGHHRGGSAGSARVPRWIAGMLRDREEWSDGGIRLAGPQLEICVLGIPTSESRVMLGYGLQSV